EPWIGRAVVVALRATCEAGHDDPVPRRPAVLGGARDEPTRATAQVPAVLLVEPDDVQRVRRVDRGARLDLRVRIERAPCGDLRRSVVSGTGRKRVATGRRQDRRLDRGRSGHRRHKESQANDERGEKQSLHLPIPPFTGLAAGSWQTVTSGAPGTR